jgi:hypothetical protein
MKKSPDFQNEIGAFLFSPQAASTYSST